MGKGLTVKKYLQFVQLSTGYIAGTIPPRFSDEHKKPIDKCGSDGVMPIDGRFSSATIHRIAKQETPKRGAIGYKICHGLTCNGASVESRIFFV